MASKNGNGNTTPTPERDPRFKYDSQGRKLYTITSLIEGEKFVREVPLIGIPFWVPQKREDQPKLIVGTIEDIVEIPANEAVHFAARRGMLLKTRDSYFVVPAGAAIERQMTELVLGVGQRIVVEFLGYGKDKGNGTHPALRMNISVSQGKAEGGETKTQTATT